MECSEPGAIREEELVAYLDGKRVRPVVVEHLVYCQECSTRLATYQRIELNLVNKLYRWDCPSNQILGEYQLGWLSTELVAQIKSHLRQCVLCATEVATLTEFLSNDPLLVERVQVVHERVSVQTSTNSYHPVMNTKRILDQFYHQTFMGNQPLIAAFVPPQPRLAYQRDAGPSNTEWPRRYVADDVNISLQMEYDHRQRDSFQLIGFVTRQGASLAALQGISVQILSQARRMDTQQIDELGNFVFSSLGSATYSLELQFPENTIIIEQIPVVAPDGL